MNKQNDDERMNRVQMKEGQMRESLQDVMKFVYQDQVSRKIGNRTKASIVSKYLKRDNFPQKTKQQLTLSYLDNYNQQMIKQIKRSPQFKKPIDKKDNITQLQRPQIIKQLFLCLGQLKLCNEVYFRTINIIDIYISKCHKVLTYEELFDIAAYCMNIVMKYELAYIEENKNSKGLFIKPFKIETQLQILSVLYSQLTAPTLYHCLNHAIIMVQNHFHTCLNLEDKHRIITIAKVILIDQNIALHNGISLALAILMFSIHKLSAFKYLSQTQVITFLSQLYHISEQQIKELIQSITIYYDFL